MRRVHRSKSPYPFDLFTPQPKWPTWDSLPAAVTQKVTVLLAEMLRDHRSPQGVRADPKEADHE